MYVAHWRKPIPPGFLKGTTSCCHVLSLIHSFRGWNFNRQTRSMSLSTLRLPRQQPSPSQNRSIFEWHLPNHFHLFWTSAVFRPWAMRFRLIIMGIVKRMWTRTTAKSLIWSLFPMMSLFKGISEIFETGGLMATWLCQAGGIFGDRHGSLDFKTVVSWNNCTYTIIRWWVVCFREFISFQQFWSSDSLELDDTKLVSLMSFWSLASLRLNGAIRYAW